MTGRDAEEAQKVYNPQGSSIDWTHRTQERVDEIMSRLRSEAEVERSPDDDHEAGGSTGPGPENVPTG